MISSIPTTLHHHLTGAPSPSRLCVALSGGLDSVVLLHLLACQGEACNFQLQALHVHHGLSPNAETWTAFCTELCQQLNVPLTVERVAVARDSGLGIEASARAARYEAFGRCGADFVVLAHHRDDQAETLLLNLLRGAGVHGAAAMPEVRSLFPGGPKLLRPLLNVSRAELETWGRAQGLRWIEDESNADVAYSRNFLRHQVLPPLTSRFPGSEGALARAASHFAEGAGLLDELAEMDLAGVGQGNGLSVAALAGLSEARARNLLRFWMRGQGLSVPDTETLTEALHQLKTARAEADLAVGLGGGQVLRRYRGVAFLVKPTPAPEAMIWNGESELPWAGGVLKFRATTGEGIGTDKLFAGQTLVRLRQAGDRLRIHARRPSRTLKNLLQESDIPPWERKIIPCIESSGVLLWVAGLGIATEAGCKPGEAGFLVEWLPADPVQA